MLISLAIKLLSQGKGKPVEAGGDQAGKQNQQAARGALQGRAHAGAHLRGRGPQGNHLQAHR